MAQYRCMYADLRIITKYQLSLYSVKRQKYLSFVKSVFNHEILHLVKSIKR